VREEQAGDVETAADQVITTLVNKLMDVGEEMKNQLPRPGAVE
jgi:hypothetical protein